MPLPMTPSTPAALQGVTNGKVPAQLLRSVDFSGIVRTQSNPADRAFRCLVAKAAEAGFTLKTTGGYRSYEDQVTLFVTRYRPTSQVEWNATPSERRKLWLDAYKEGYTSSWWVMRQLPNGSWPAMAATPGTSNHGMGYSNDLAEENDGDPAADPLRPELVSWLRSHAALYGLVNEVSSENWHWTYVTGDDVPQAVLQWENPPKPTPPPPKPVPTGGIVYKIIAIVGSNDIFGGMFDPNGICPQITWLNPTRYTAVKNAGAPTVSLARTDLKNCDLLGPIPPGWSSLDFANVIS